MADDVGIAEPYHRDISDRLKAARDLGETGQPIEQVALVGIAGHHHRRVPAQPGQQHLDLAIGAVLRLIDNDESVVQGAPAHKADWRDLDRSFGHKLLDPLASEPFVQGVVERAQIGRKLVADIAGEIAQALAGLDRGTGQHDAPDLSGVQRRHRGTDREIGLAGPGRTQRDRQIMMLDRRQQSALALALRTDLAAIALFALAVGARDFGLVDGIAGGMVRRSKADDRSDMRRAFSHPRPPSP